jgi:hypothetical protein
MSLVLLEMAPSYDGETIFIPYPTLRPRPLIRDDLARCDITRNLISVVSLEDGVVTSHTNQALS